MANESNFNNVVCDAIKVGATTITGAIAAALATLFSAFGSVAFDRAVKIAKVPLAAVDTGGGVFSWANPEAGDIIVERVILDITTQSSGACTVDVGTTASGATTSIDNLIDGLSVASAAQVADNLGNAGSNGKTRQRLATGKWVNGSVASGASAGLAGYAYIHYIPV
jgi:hypothetical protein